MSQNALLISRLKARAILSNKVVKRIVLADGSVVINGVHYTRQDWLPGMLVWICLYADGSPRDPRIEQVTPSPATTGNDWLNRPFYSHTNEPLDYPSDALKPIQTGPLSDDVLKPLTQKAGDEQVGCVLKALLYVLDRHAAETRELNAKLDKVTQQLQRRDKKADGVIQALINLWRGEPC